jgi:penicillin V acylase-like amidase (Ntn superfamily)
MEQFGYDPNKLDGATDGMNEKGLAFHLLNLDATEYPKPNTDGKPNVSYCRWGRYVLDNFATVEEAVEGMKKINIISCLLNGKEIGGHVAIEDATDDSAIFEYTDGGKLHIYHGKEYLVMTNDPPIDKQVEMLADYDGFGGSLPLPGSTSSEDRFVRLSYYLPFLKKQKISLKLLQKYIVS